MRDLPTATGDSGAGINGETPALAVDRAIGELRRGRAIALDDTRGFLVVAAIETTGSRLLAQIASSSAEASLFLTAERARAGGISPDAAGPIALALTRPLQVDVLKSLAGIAAAGAHAVAGSRRISGDEAALVLAAFGLAKAARLIPALVGFRTGNLVDASLHRVSLDAILEYAAGATTGIQLVSEARVPLAGAESSRVALFRDEFGGGEHVAVVIGEPDLAGSVPVRLHSACLTGDLLGSLRCDCGEQLRTAVEQIAGMGGGILLYLDQEGRSIGLANKLRAYAIQDTGVDTFDADHRLGFSADERSYDLAAAMLQQMGVARVRLLTNNPAKIEELREHGIDVVERLPLQTRPNVHNAAYLRSKRERAGHLGD